MGWKIWEKWLGTDASGGGGVRLPRPKELPSHIGMHLVVREKQDPDWVWALKLLKHPSERDAKLYDFRIFNVREALEAGVQVDNYNSLNAHPDLVLYHGYSNRNGSVFNIEIGNAQKAA
jgi:hypothetical protein